MLRNVLLLTLMLFTSCGQDESIRLIPGPKGFDSTTKTNYVEINSKSGVIGGIGYDRLLNEAVSVGGQVLSNGTMALSLGLDF